MSVFVAACRFGVCGICVWWARLFVVPAAFDLAFVLFRFVCGEEFGCFGSRVCCFANSAVTCECWELNVSWSMVAKTVVVISRSVSSGKRVVERRLRVVALIVVVAKVGTMAACEEGQRADGKKRQGAGS